MYTLTDTEFNAVKSLNAEYRQAHFLQKLKDNNEIYILVDNNGPLMLEDNDITADGDVKSMILPVFCHERFANLFKDLQDNKDSLQIKSVTREAWQQSWVPFLQENSVLLGIMPLDDKDFTVLEPDFTEVKE